MNVEIADILAKIPMLPPDYAEHVHLGEIVADSMMAEVESFSEHPAPRSYAVAIKRADEPGQLEANCICPARTLCKHIVAFYAVAKAKEPEVIAAVAQIAPQSTESDAGEPEPVGGDVGPDPHTKGLRLIARAQEKFGQATPSCWRAWRC